MRKKLVAIAVLLCAGAPLQPAAQGSLRYTVELEDLRETVQRLELRTPGWRLLALERGAGLEPDLLAFGLECPWAAVGPLAPRGLLRALSDPLGYSPASRVFSEPAGFRLEGGLEGASRSGLWLEPLPGRLGLFLVRRPPQGTRSLSSGLLAGGPMGLLQAGGSLTFRWQAPGRPGGPGLAQAPAPVQAEAQALALLSRPEADPEMDSRAAPPATGASAPTDWLLDRPPFPGGSLLHLGGALRLEAGGGRLSCFLLAASSGGQRVPAGLLGLGRLEAEGRRWNARALLGACSKEYRLPQGELYPGAWAAGLRLEVQPMPALRLGADWRRRIDRPPAMPESRLPGSEGGRLDARLAVPLRAGGRLEARAAAEARAKYAAAGGTEGTASADLGLELAGHPGSLALELQADWMEEGIGLRALLCGQRGGARLQAGAAVRPAGEQPGSGELATHARWHPFGRLELAGRDFLFWLSAGSGDSGREIRLGWSAVQPLKSPTVSTSRCRR